MNRKALPIAVILLAVLMSYESTPASAGDAAPGNGAAPAVTTKQDSTAFAVVDDMPAVVKTVPPVYPAEARKAGREGRVMVQAFVGKNGRVAKVRVAEGHSAGADFDKAALAAVSQWQFTPAKVKGKPISIWIAVPVVFRLH